MENISNDVKDACLEILDKAKAKSGDVFLLGGSSSEVIGEDIGKATNKEVGEDII